METLFWEQQIWIHICEVIIHLLQVNNIILYTVFLICWLILFQRIREFYHDEFPSCMNYFPWHSYFKTGGDDKSADATGEDLKEDLETSVKSGETSAVFSSLPIAIKWIRDSAQRNHSVRFQVILIHLLFSPSKCGGLRYDLYFPTWIAFMNELQFSCWFIRS